MREIKFRAWDKQANEMNYDGCLGSGSSADIISIEFSGKLNIQNAYGLDFGMRNPSFDPPVDKFILMQFTGLKDKNGKDIYEGDVIRNSRGDWGVIVWKAPFFETTVSENQSSLYTREYYMESEVIGNIHENPELLNQQ